jgi:tetratricopeptide (TPR) repeat protein
VLGNRTALAARRRLRNLTKRGRPWGCTRGAHPYSGVMGGDRTVSENAAPASGRAWHQLGVALVKAGKLDAACEALRRAVTLEPEASPEATSARNNLGLVLQLLGDTKGALAQFTAALMRAPDSAELRNNLAAVLATMGQFERALDEARRAVALKPDLIGAHVHAGMIEMELGHLDEALRWIEGILPAAPDSVEILLVEADILGRLDRVEAALRVYARAAALQPRSGLPLAGQAVLLCQHGRAGEADEVLRRALAADPDCAAAWYTSALIRRFAPGDPAIAAMEAILRGGRAPAYNDRLGLHFALGGAYLDIGDGARAFAHLAEGARMKRALVAYDGDARERWLGAIAEGFPAARFAEARGQANPSELPVFVVGMPRSGTTLVEQILGAHPRIHAAGERRTLEQAVARALQTRDTYAFPKALEPEHGPAIAADYLAEVAALAPGAERIVDKTLGNIAYAGLIHLIMPRARIILCRRDPVDTCLSSYSKLFTSGQEFSYDFAELGQYFRAQDRLAAHWRRVLPPEIFLEVEYESVVADLEGAARRIVAFCGLDWSPSCLAFHETRQPVRTASMTQVRRPIYQTSVGRWHNFASYLGPLLAALGVSA